jgi:hypothetical protein
MSNQLIANGHQVVVKLDWRCARFEHRTECGGQFGKLKACHIVIHTQLKPRSFPFPNFLL